ncbi:MAG: hypothetical protein IT165_14670 [Bryobacterales bacterium]|nr:hypothetical protein [Bryobacterales bacterium]
MSRGIVFRLLYTLEKAGLVAKAAPNLYHSMLSRPPRRRWKIGYAAPGLETSFTVEVGEGLQLAADKQEALQLLLLDN